MPEVEQKDTTLTTAVEKAIESQDKSDVIIDKEEDTEKPQEVETSPQDDEDTINGRLLVQSLKDPQKAAAIVRYLATQYGYTKEDIQTKQDVKEVSKGIEGILEKHLGDDFKFLAPKLGPAIKESLESMLQGNTETANLRERLERQEFKDIQNETSNAHVEIAHEWFGSDEMPDNVVKAMSSAMDDFPPTDPNMSPARYYKKIFSMVAGELGLQKKEQKRQDRVERNRQDSGARFLTSQNRGVVPDNAATGARKLSLKDAVSLAMEQVEQSSKK